MNLEIEQPRLLSALNLAQSVAERNNSNPILSHVLLQADSATQTASVTSTDLTVSAHEVASAEVSAGGGVTLSAKRLRDVVKTLPAGTIKITALDNAWVELTSGRSKFKLMGHRADDFPNLPRCAERRAAASAPVLADLIAHTLHSVSTDNSRVNLCGALLEHDGKTATMVSTDGHRLTKITAPFDGPALPAPIVLPRKGLIELRKAIDRFGGGEFCLAIDDGHVFADIDTLTLAIKISNITFPPWRQVVPKAHDRVATVGREDLLSALQQCSVLAPDRTAMVRIELRDSTLQIVADNPEMGTSHQTLDVDYDGDPLTMGVNANYVREALSVLDCETVRLELQGELDPLVIKPCDGPDYTAVVMPMRV